MQLALHILSLSCYKNIINIVHVLKLFMWDEKHALNSIFPNFINTYENRSDTTLCTFDENYYIIIEYHQLLIFADKMRTLRMCFKT